MSLFALHLSDWEPNPKTSSDETQICFNPSEEFGANVIDIMKCVFLFSHCIVRRVLITSRLGERAGCFVVQSSE